MNVNKLSMAKKTTEKSTPVKKARSPKYSKTKGNAYELKIAKELRDLGFPGVVTSRSESKRFDAKKVDLIDTEGKLPVHIQLKKTQATPSYFKIQEASGLTDKPFIIIWSKEEKKEVNICSRGEVVMIPKEFFYTLLKKYCKL